MLGGAGSVRLCFENETRRRRECREVTGAPARNAARGPAPLSRPAGQGPVLPRGLADQGTHAPGALRMAAWPVPQASSPHSHAHPKHTRALSGTPGPRTRADTALAACRHVAQGRLAVLLGSPV